MQRLTAFVWIVAALSAGAQTSAPTTPSFSPPQQMKAGAAVMGGTRLYPSPTFHDVNGDGRLDLVIGCLVGKLTFALRSGASDAPAFAAEEKLEGASKKPLKFHNW